MGQLFPQRGSGGGDADTPKDEALSPSGDGTDLIGREHRAMGAAPAAGRNAESEMNEHSATEAMSHALSVSPAPDPESAEALIAFVRERQLDQDGSGEWLPFALHAYDRMVRERERERLASLGARGEQQRLRVAERSAGHSNDAPLFVDYPEAARLLSCSVAALKHRKGRGQIPSRFMLETGRRVQFRRALLAELKTSFAGRRP